MTLSQKTQTDQEKGNCNAHENKEEDTEIKELENVFDNIDLNASPAKPENTNILYERLITNLQSDIIFKAALEGKTSVFYRRDYLPPKPT